MTDIFDIIAEYYKEIILPKCITHLNENGKVVDTNGIPLKPTDPIPYTSNDSLLILYDGRDLLKKACKMLTSKNGKLSKTAKVERLEDLLIAIKEVEGNKSDSTWFYNHESREIASTRTGLKNFDQNVEGHKLIKEGLPDDFLSSDGSVSKYDIGQRTSVALLTTAKHDIGAIIVKVSEYEIGGKVAHFREGMLIEEIFARYNKDEELIELVHRTYKPINNGITLDQEKVKPYIQLSPASYNNRTPERKVA